MSLSDSKKSQSKAQPQTTTTGFEQHIPNVEAPQLTSLGSMFSVGFNRSGGTGQAKTLAELIKGVFDKSTSDQDFSVFSLRDGEAGNTGIDAVVIWTKLKGVCQFYSIFIESTARGRSTVPYQYPAGNGVNMSVKRPLHDLGDNANKTVINAVVARYAGVPVEGVGAAGFLMLHDTSTPVLDSDSAARSALVNNVIAAATNACVMVLEESLGGSNRIITPAMLNSFATPYSNVIDVKYETGEEVIGSSTDTPIRSAIRLTGTLKPLATNAKATLLADSVELFNVDGYIDLKYRQDFESTTPPMTQRYTPAFVITRVDSPQGNMLTPQTLLFGIYAAAGLGHNNNWMNGLSRYQLEHEQSANKKGSKLSRSVGAFGYECPYFVPGGDGKTAKFIELNSTVSHDSVTNLISMAVYGGKLNESSLLLQMDITPSEDLGWLESILLGAATNSYHENGARVNDEGSYRVLYNWCNRATNGEFGKLFAYGDHMCWDTNTLIPNGTFDIDGKTVDIRSSDYLANLNGSGKNGNGAFQDDELMNIYSQCLDRPDRNQYERYDQYVKVILEQQYKNVVVHGFRHRITINPIWIQAFAAASLKAGISFSMSQSANMGDGGVRRYYNNVAPDSVMNTRGMFTTNTMFQGNGAVNTSFNTGWGSNLR